MRRDCYNQIDKVKRQPNEGQKMITKTWNILQQYGQTSAKSRVVSWRMWWSGTNYGRFVKDDGTRIQHKRTLIEPFDIDNNDNLHFAEFSTFWNN